MPDPNFIIAPEIAALQVGLEPVYNMLHSFMLLNKADHLSGLGDWVTRTKAALTPEEDYRNRLVLYGLFYAVEPDRSWHTFEEYIEHLATIDPKELRDRVFRTYAPQWLVDDGTRTIIRADFSIDDLDVEALLNDVDQFLAFLAERYPAEAIDIQLESEAHRYLNDPPALQRLVTSHLREMWESYGAPEWQRIEAMLQASVDAFRKVDFGSMTKTEAMSIVAGQQMEVCLKHDLEKYGQIVFIPSAHVGPYTGKFMADETLYLIFGARIPEGIDVNVPDLSRSEILVRVNALADDSRLRILRLISEEGELRSQEIMTQLDLSQSASSRHLKQLSATGFLIERRCNGAKCYDLNPQKIENTLNAISKYLLGH